MSEPAIALRPIPREEAHVLGNLFELYCHDFSEHVALALDAEGRFAVPIDDAWWARPDDHFPFFVLDGDRLVGFALVRRGSRVGGAADAMDVAEFFIVRGARRRNAGLRAAHALLSRFPAVWEIRVRASNSAAHAFWARVADEWLGRSAPWVLVDAGGKTWRLCRFDSRPAHRTTG